MKRPRLDLSALYKRRLPSLPRAGFSAIDLLNNQSRFSLTRRDMLGLAGTAAASLPLKFGAPEGRLQFVPGDKRVAFRQDGRERWVIDTRCFSGTPALRVTQSKDLVRVALVNARYPGTQLPADLECKLERLPAGWRMHLRMALGGFKGESPFERWLRGKAELRSAVQLDESIAGPGNSSSLSIAGRAQAEFLPNWTLRLTGKGIVGLSGFGGETVSDSLAIVLLDPQEPSIVSKPRQRRTLLAMNRDERSWPFQPLLGGDESSNLIVSDSAFDRIRIEAGEDAGGADPAFALIADARSGQPGVVFTPDGDFGSSDGKQFHVPLRNARYAITSDAGGQHAALVANYAHEPLWVHAEGCSFEIGDSEAAPAFESVSVNGRSPRIRCTPALKQIAAPLPGVIVQVRPLPEGTQLAFLLPPQNQQERIILGRIPKKKKKKEAQQPKKKTPVRLQVRPGKVNLGGLAAPGRTSGEPRPRPKEGGNPAQTPSGGLTAPGRILGVPQSNPTEGGAEPRTPPREFGTPPRLQPGQINVVVPGSPGKRKILPNPVIRPTSEQRFSFDIIRPDDLLALTFDFYNMTLSAGEGTPSLVRGDPNQPAYLVVQFGPQHIAEEAFLEDSSGQPLRGKAAQPPILSRLAGGSRLAFIVPDSVAQIPYALESLLNWSQFEQSVTPLATPRKPLYFTTPAASGSVRTIKQPNIQAIQSSPEYYQQIQPSAISPEPVVTNRKNKKSKRNRQSALMAQREMQIAHGPLIQLDQVKEPEIFQTALEVPYRMVLSPSYYAGWAHSLKPVEHSGVTELWHTRLGVRFQQGTVDEQDDYYRTVRAVWATDYQAGCLPVPQADTTPFATRTINSRQRYEIVRLSSDPTITTVSNTVYVPQPIQVNRLMLSTMGAWMNTNGAWEPPEDVREPACQGGKFSFNVESWRHIAAMGRDQYVRIVERGYLFPFGHRAVKITITERKFNKTPSGDMAAYLRQQIFVVVREHEKSYPATGQPHPQGPQLPFQTVRIDTLSTPALDQPVDILPGDAAFFPRVDNQDFQFKMVGVDWEGNTTEFTAPLIFVIADSARNMQQTSTVLGSYNNDPDTARRVRPFFGQKVAYAKNKLPGDTAFETDSLSFVGEVAENPQIVPTGQPYFYPAILQAAVRIATVEQLTGLNAATDIAYDATYLAHGIEAAANQGQVFAKLLNSVPLAFGGSGGGSDKVGGLLTPSMDISGLSRLLGPVAGDLATITGGTFDPKQFFNAALGAKLLGDISLADVINTVSNLSSAVEKVPKFITSHLPNSVQTSFTWQPEVQDVGQPAFFKVTGDRSQALTVNATLTKTLDNNPPSYEVSAVLKTFEVHLVPSVIEVLVVKFKKLSFKSVNGKKPDVSADLDTIEFAGPLSFINELKNLIPTDGFTDPPSLDVTAQGIEMGYSLGLPPVSIGVFNLSNVSLAAQLNIYFTGDPITFKFDFCQQEQPFLLTVSLFGGGGYFGLTLTPAGIQRMAAEFEFGGSFSLNLGVASGGVYVMAGFSYVYTNGNTELTGYLRCGGSLEVLAIITVSVEFKMGLTYVSAGNKVWGRATLTVEVKVLFFSQSVDLTVEREFAGGGAQNAALYGAGAPYPVGATPVHFADQVSAADWQLYCEAFA